MALGLLANENGERKPMLVIYEEDDDGEEEEEEAGEKSVAAPPPASSGLALCALLPRAKLLLGDKPGGENTDDGEGDTARCGGHDGRVSTTFRLLLSWVAARAAAAAESSVVWLPADAAGASVPLASDERGCEQHALQDTTWHTLQPRKESPFGKFRWHVLQATAAPFSEVGTS